MNNFTLKGEWLSVNVRSLLARALDEASEAAGAPATVCEDTLLRLMLLYTENARALALLRELGVTSDALAAWREARANHAAGITEA